MSKPQNYYITTLFGIRKNKYGGEVFLSIHSGFVEE